MLAIDTETTGLDLHHAARPFFVTTCNREGENVFFEWSVDPITRVPNIPQEDVADIRKLIKEQLLLHSVVGGNEDGRPLVMHNGKFDMAVLKTIGVWEGFNIRKVWEGLNDTLIAGHLLASNQPHNLTDMTVQYLGVDIEPHEKAMHAACEEARRMCRSKAFKAEHGEWTLAEKGQEGMPSATDSCWKYDMWLPRAIAQRLNYDEDHPWWTLLREYANADSSATMFLWKAMKEEIESRGLWEIYVESMRLPRIFHDMQDSGVTLSKSRLLSLLEEFQEESDRHGRVCVNIAAGYRVPCPICSVEEPGLFKRECPECKMTKTVPYELNLPKGGRNNSLLTFCFDVMKLEPVRNPKAKSDSPSLDSKTAIPYYQTTLPHTSKELSFINNLAAKRARDTAIGYLRSYMKFWIPINDEKRRAGSDSPKVLEICESGESDRVLDLDRGKVRERIRSIPGLQDRRNQSTQSQLGSAQRSNTGGAIGSTQLPNRGQSSLRKPGSPISGDTSGQYGGYEEKGQEQKGLRRGTGVLQADQYGGQRDKKTVQERSGTTGPTSGIMQNVQYQSSSNVLYNQRNILEASAIDNDTYVLHPSLNQTGTDTLRCSSNSPNSQNISKREEFNVRYCFGPAPGRVWYACDYENLELKIPAYLANEEGMIALFERPKEPPYFGSHHLLAAHILHKEKFEACLDANGNLDGRIFKKRYESTLYQWTKNGNFASQYGAIPESGTADRAYHVPGGQLMIQASMRKIAELNQRTIAYANKFGYVETVPDRTVNPKKGYPIVCGRSDWGKISPTIPLSYKIQSTAMWCTRRAMVRCQDRLDEWFDEDGYDGRIVMQIHDEIDFDMPADDPRNDERVEELAALMAQSGDDIGIPLSVSIKYHPNNWSEEVKR